MSFVLIVGNTVDGLRFFGPFEDCETAQGFADSNHFSDCIGGWHLAELERTDEIPIPTDLLESC